MLPAVCTPVWLRYRSGLLYLLIKAAFGQLFLCILINGLLKHRAFIRAVLHDLKKGTCKNATLQFNMQQKTM
jgi:hypothetical protein